MDCARKREAGAPAFTWFQHRLSVDPQPRGFHYRHTGSHWHHWLHRQGPHTLPLVPACLCTLYTIIHSITYSSTNYPQSHRPSMFHLTTEAANGSHLYLLPGDVASCFFHQPTRMQSKAVCLNLSTLWDLDPT